MMKKRNVVLTKMAALLLALILVLVPTVVRASEVENSDFDEPYLVNDGGYGSGGYQNFMPFSIVTVNNPVQLFAALADSSVTGIHVGSLTPIGITTANLSAAGLPPTLEINVPVTAAVGGFTVGSGVTLILNNSLTGFPGTGTGVTVNAGGHFEMNHDSASISNFDNRGVVVRESGTFFMRGGSIYGNLAPGPGGFGGAGVLVDGTENVNFSPTFVMYGGIIEENISGSHGGGVSVVRGASFEMRGGHIRGNEAGAMATGGGVHVSGSTFCLYNGFITGNNANRGGGVDVTNAIFTMHSGNIDGNTARYGGGGVHTGGTAEFTMHDGSISGNSAAAATGVPQGGGVFVSGYQFNMLGGAISNNTAAEGGGVFHIRNEFNMYGGTISRNTATINDPGRNSGGGGVMIAIHGQNPTERRFFMSGGIITDNFAPNGNGGGINVYGGLDGGHGLYLCITGGSITNNVAGVHGGGISVRQSVPVIHISDSTISGNIAGGNGGAIGLLSPGVNLTIEGTTTINNNTAANGGGIGFNLANTAPEDDFKEFLENVEISGTVRFNGNVATEGSRPNLILWGYKTDELGRIIPIYVTQNYGTGAFTNNYIHTPFVEMKQLKVTKDWVGGTLADRPESITVELLVRTDEADPWTETGRTLTIIPNPSGYWVGFFETLLVYDIDGSEFIYSIKELNVPTNFVPDVGVITEPEEGSNLWTITLANIFREPPPRRGVTTFTVNKVWTGDENHLSHRPATIIVELRLPGQVAPVRTQVLTAANGWTHIWEGIEFVYGEPFLLYVVEPDVPPRYVATVAPRTGNVVDGFAQTITNTFTPPIDDDDEDDERRGGRGRRGPLTGDLAGTAPLLAGLLFAMSSVLGGTSLKKKLKRK